MIITDKVSFCAIEKEMLPQLKEWRNQPELRKVFREYRLLTTTHQNNWYENTVINDKNTEMFGIIADKNLIGVCGLCYIDWINRKGEFSIYIGDTRYIKGGYGYESMKLLCYYGFDILNLHKIWGDVYSINIDRLNFFKNFGFIEEGILRDNYYYNGKYYNSHMISILKEEYEQKIQNNILSLIKD